MYVSSKISWATGHCHPEVQSSLAALILHLSPLPFCSNLFVSPWNSFCGDHREVGSKVRSQDQWHCPQILGFSGNHL